MVARSSTLLEMEVKRRVCLPCTTQLDLMTRQRMNLQIKAVKSMLSRMLQEGESREHQAVLNKESNAKEFQGTMPRSIVKENQAVLNKQSKERLIL